MNNMKNSSHSPQEAGQGGGLNRASWVVLGLAVGLSVVGMLMLLLALLLPPRGTIEASVLVAYGEVMTFVGALLGITSYHKHF